MSWSFQLSMINYSFDKIAKWYSEFMRRTEISFKVQEQRILRLEEQLQEKQTGPGPSDEQLERVLRKILAEKFSDSPSSQPASTTPSRDHFFVEDPKGSMYPSAIQISPAALFVTPDAVPSKAYVETFRMLQSGLRHFPNGNTSPFESDEYDEYDEGDDDAKDTTMTATDNKRPRLSSSV